MPDHNIRIKLVPRRWTYRWFVTVLEQRCNVSMVKKYSKRAERLDLREIFVLRKSHVDGHMARAGCLATQDMKGR
jgi:hypothetical protein